MTRTETDTALAITAQLLAIAIQKNDGQVDASMLIKAQRDAQTLPMLDGADWDEVRHEIARRMNFTVGKQGTAWVYIAK